MEAIMVKLHNAVVMQQRKLKLVPGWQVVDRDRG